MLETKKAIIMYRKPKNIGDIDQNP